VRAAPQPNGLRDTWAGSVDAARVGDEVRVAGWVHRRRDHGGLIFIDLRDRSGLLQLTFHPDSSGPAFAAAERLRSEHVVSVRGKVVAREEGNVNPKMPTGEVEVDVAEMQVLAEAETPVFPVDEDTDVAEETRLRHRVLDLRRERMTQALVLRSQVVHAMRQTLEERDFLEVETPILTRSTPEGARDFLVPARLQAGSWYALPQSPQLFKQLLMMSGLERYYQVARCFRDEDLRADRQPEFTQLDLEMAFVEEEQVIEVMEAVMTKVFDVAGLPVGPAPWPRMGYDEALSRFGSDRPDTRFGLELADVGQAFAQTEFRVFRSLVEGGGAIRGFRVPGHDFPRKDLDAMTARAQQLGASGLVWIKPEADGTFRSSIKALGEAELRGASETLGGEPGDTLLLVAGEHRKASEVLGALRLDVAKQLGLVEEGRHDLLWVVDFPMFERTDDGGLTPLHHPFTAPKGDLDADPLTWSSRAYDLVLDGTEIGGGSIRIHDRAVQARVLDAIGIDEEEAQARFGFLLDALRFGAPPHGGIAMGIDRIVAICAGRESIRDVIAFPKTASGGDPLTGAPAPVEDGQLRELAVRSLVERPPGQG
jgi:aspartyl-tRNA synthetase